MSSAEVVPWIEKAFAALVVATCVLLLLRLLIGASRRARFESAIRRFARRTRLGASAATEWPFARRRASREAAEAIRRARLRAGVSRDGNVLRPKAFDSKRKRRDLH